VLRDGGWNKAMYTVEDESQTKVEEHVFKNFWRQGCGEWLFPLQSPFSTAGLPAALEAAVNGGSTEESSTLILL
jgi:hypothetical protein